MLPNVNRTEVSVALLSAPARQIHVRLLLDVGQIGAAQRVASTAEVIHLKAGRPISQRRDTTASHLCTSVWRRAVNQINGCREASLAGA